MTKTKTTPDPTSCNTPESLVGLKSFMSHDYSFLLHDTKPQTSSIVSCPNGTSSRIPLFVKLVGCFILLIILMALLFAGCNMPNGITFNKSRIEPIEKLEKGENLPSLIAVPDELSDDMVQHSEQDRPLIAMVKKNFDVFVKDTAGTHPQEKQEEKEEVPILPYSVVKDTTFVCWPNETTTSLSLLFDQEDHVALDEIVTKNWETNSLTSNGVVHLLLEVDEGANLEKCGQEEDEEAILEAPQEYCSAIEPDNSILLIDTILHQPAATTIGSIIGTAEDQLLSPIETDTDLPVEVIVGVNESIKKPEEQEATANGAAALHLASTTMDRDFFQSRFKASLQESRQAVRMTWNVIRHGLGTLGQSSQRVSKEARTRVGLGARRGQDLVQASAKQSLIHSRQAVNTTLNMVGHGLHQIGRSAQNVYKTTLAGLDTVGCHVQFQAEQSLLQPRQGVNATLNTVGHGLRWTSRSAQKVSKVTLAGLDTGARHLQSQVKQSLFQSRQGVNATLNRVGHGLRLTSRSAQTLSTVTLTGLGTGARRVQSQANESLFKTRQAFHSTSNYVIGMGRSGQRFSTTILNVFRNRVQRGHGLVQSRVIEFVGTARRGVNASLYVAGRDLRTAGRFGHTISTLALHGLGHGLGRTQGFLQSCAKESVMKSRQAVNATLNIVARDLRAVGRSGRTVSTVVLDRLTHGAYRGQDIALSQAVEMVERARESVNGTLNVLGHGLRMTTRSGQRVSNAVSTGLATGSRSAQELLQSCANESAIKSRQAVNATLNVVVPDLRAVGRYGRSVSNAALTSLVTLVHGGQYLVRSQVQLSLGNARQAVGAVNVALHGIYNGVCLGQNRLQSRVKSSLGNTLDAVGLTLNVVGHGLRVAGRSGQRLCTMTLTSLGNRNRDGQYLVQARIQESWSISRQSFSCTLKALGRDLRVVGRSGQRVSTVAWNGLGLGLRRGPDVIRSRVNESVGNARQAVNASLNVIGRDLQALDRSRQKISSVTLDWIGTVGRRGQELLHSQIQPPLGKARHGVDEMSNDIHHVRGESGLRASDIGLGRLVVDVGGRRGPGFVRLRLNQTVGQVHQAADSTWNADDQDSLTMSPSGQRVSIILPSDGFNNDRVANRKSLALHRQLHTSRRFAGASDFARGALLFSDAPLPQETLERIEIFSSTSLGIRMEGMGDARRAISEAFPADTRRSNGTPLDESSQSTEPSVIPSVGIRMEGMGDARRAISGALGGLFAKPETGLGKHRRFAGASDFARNALLLSNDTTLDHYSESNSPSVSPEAGIRIEGMGDARRAISGALGGLLGNLATDRVKNGVSSMGQLGLFQQRRTSE